MNNHLVLASWLLVVSAISLLLIMQNEVCQRDGMECEDPIMRAVAMGLLLSSTTWLFVAMRTTIVPSFCTLLPNLILNLPPEEFIPAARSTPWGLLGLWRLPFPEVVIGNECHQEVSAVTGESTVVLTRHINSVTIKL
jgi:hypothetical protein